MASMDYRELRFIDYSSENYLQAFNDLLNIGKKSFLLCGFNNELSEFIIQTEKYKKNHLFDIYKRVYDSNEGLAGNENPEIKIGNIDVIIFFINDAPFLSSILIKYSGLNCVILAPITSHYYKNRPVLVNSIPKSGVHMLFEGMRAFGFKEPKNLDLPDYYDVFHPGCFYNLQHMTLDYLSLPYPKVSSFVSNFCNSVVLFMIRDPRDIAISLAHYVASLNDYHILKEYFGKLSLNQQVSSVIKGEYPFPVYLNKKLSFSGNIRDLMLLYGNWVKCSLSNTIFLRYEELVGEKGGGTEEAQLNCLWRLQLALNIPGKPSDYAPKIYSESSATFRRGKISGFKDEFTIEHHNLLEAFPQDFMDLYGYGQETGKTVLGDPGNFKGCITLDIDKKQLLPILLEENYRGFNIVQYNRQYYGINLSLGDIDLGKTDSSSLNKYKEENKLVVGNSVNEIKYLVDNLSFYILKKNVEAKDKEINNLSKQASEFKATIENFNKTIEGQARNVGKLESDVSSCKQELAGLNRDVSRGKEGIAHFDKDLESQLKKTSELESEFFKHKDEINNINKVNNEKITELNFKFNEMQNYACALQDEINNIKNKLWYRFFNWREFLFKNKKG